MVWTTSYDPTPWSNRLPQVLREENEEREAVSLPRQVPDHATTLDRATTICCAHSSLFNTKQHRQCLSNLHTTHNSTHQTSFRSPPPLSNQSQTCILCTAPEQDRRECVRLTEPPVAIPLSWRVSPADWRCRQLSLLSRGVSEVGAILWQKRQALPKLVHKAQGCAVKLWCSEIKR